jgi:hypothetical protein
MAASTPYQTIDAPPPTAGLTTIPINSQLAGITGTVDLLTDYVVPHSFQILGLRFAVTTVASTASKLATVALYVGPTASAVAVPGASIALTTALVTPIGKIFLSPATAQGVNAPIYPGGTKIQLKCSSVTAFVEGSGTFFIDLRNVDES